MLQFGHLADSAARESDADADDDHESGGTVILSHPSQPEPGQMTLRDQFHNACGFDDGRFELTVCRDDEDAHFTLEQPFALIGRADGADLRFDDPAIGYRHAYLQLIAGRVYCFDIGSRSGLHFGSKWRHRGRLDPGDQLLLGPFAVRLLREFAARDEADDVPARPLVLEFGRHRRQVRLTRHVNLVGSGKNCDLRLRNKGRTSRAHGSILITPGGPWIVDTLSRFGTFVNGERVRFAPLHPGDVIRLGDYEFRVTGDDHDSFVDDVDSASSSHESAGTWDLGGDAAPPGVSEEFVLDLVDRFTAMQQQLLASTQQQTTRLVEALVSSNGRLLDMVQTELEELRTLDRELRSLEHQRLQHLTQSATRRSADDVSDAGPSADGHTGDAAAGDDTADEDVKDVERAEHVGRIAAERSAASHSDDEPESDVAAVVEESPSNDERGEDANTEPSDEEPPDEEPAIDAPVPDEWHDDARHESPHDAAESVDSSEHHAWIVRRMSELERRRSSVLQRLVGRLVGTH